MELVLGTEHLSAYGGSETYVVTVAEQLQKLGHGIRLYAPVTGEMATVAGSRGLEVASDLERLPERCDVVYAQEAATAFELAGRYPETPLVFAVHADGYAISVPPQLPGLASAAVVMYDRTQRMAEALAVVPEVVRLSQPVDTDRFAPRGPLHEPARSALLIGNYVWGDRRDLVARACELAGIELVEAGYRHGHFARDTAAAMADVDIVIGKARVIIEAMAAGRAAYVYDHNGGDGWVTGDRYDLLAADNFGGQVDPAAFDLARLERDLSGYRAEMGLANRDLAVRNHSANKHAQQLVSLFRRLAPRAEPAGAPLDEMARLVRLQWEAQGKMHALAVETQDMRKQLQAAERENERLARQVHELQSTRRYRLASTLARPLDLVRRSRRSEQDSP